MRTLHRRKRSKWFIRAALVTAAFVVLAGCNEAEQRANGEAWKAEIASAFEQNVSIANHRFDLELGLDGTASSADGDIRLAGISYADPIRYEADIQVASPGADVLNIPMLIQDNKLYVSVPMINQENEYLLIDLQDPEQTAAMPVSAMLQTDSPLYRLGAYLAAEADPLWVRLGAEGGPEEGGPRHFEISVTEDNAEELKPAVLSALSAWSEALPEAIAARAGVSGLLAAADNASLEAGGIIGITIDADGFVTEQQAELAFIPAKPDSGETAEPERLRYRVGLAEINASPDMTKSVPEHVISFKNVLTFMAANRQQK